MDEVYKRFKKDESDNGKLLKRGATFIIGNHKISNEITIETMKIDFKRKLDDNTNESTKANKKKRTDLYFKEVKE